MEMRIVVKLPSNKLAAQAPVTGIVYHEVGKPTRTVQIQYRQNKTSAWTNAPVVKKEDI